ncbi:DnaJ domain-containing protein [Pseudonocardia asaccharolytica]|uniref:J domain-containing protein n=1 Tax=Pseudonocardia asaccharolytica DSM 44247 = NBRC 16224 TaxID=1123024 RepID=A0A511D737_9PSEU|nr:DnaJ domain-containing protein [Pseudonocardia asaccharolytica]GEL19414.1 hypothetical protein PA7_32510 [Pseudonocardia asaccharolytica DSM 44247 = NBRC 16224]
MARIPPHDGPASNRDPYAVLGVAPGASAADIARGYRRRLRELHPDTRDPTAAREAITLDEVQAAYRALRGRQPPRDPGPARAKPRSGAGPQPPRRPAASAAADAPSRSGPVPIPVRCEVRRRPWSVSLVVGPVRVHLSF